MKNLLEYAISVEDDYKQMIESLKTLKECLKNGKTELTRKEVKIAKYPYYLGEGDREENFEIEITLKHNSAIHYETIKNGSYKTLDGIIIDLTNYENYFYSNSYKYSQQFLPKEEMKVKVKGKKYFYKTKSLIEKLEYEIGSRIRWEEQRKINALEEYQDYYKQANEYIDMLRKGLE